MSKLPRYINSLSWREGGREIAGLLLVFAGLTAFFIGLIWLGLTLTGGAY